MTEAVKEQPKITTAGDGALAGIQVKAPETNKAKTKRYFAGIVKDEALDRFQLQIRVGPVVFSTQTFAWKGQGDLAEQVFRSGAVVDLTEEQLKEVRDKLKYRYLRLYKAKDRDGEDFITGFADIDASNSGSLTKHPDGRLEQHAPQEKLGVLRGDEIPLVNILKLLPAATIEEFNGQIMTYEQAKKIVAEVEAEEKKTASDPVDFMEQGKGGLLEKKAKAKPKGADKDAERLRHLSTVQDGKRAGPETGGFLGD